VQIACIFIANKRKATGFIPIAFLVCGGFPQTFKRVCIIYYVLIVCGNSSINLKLVFWILNYDKKYLFLW